MQQSDIKKGIPIPGVTGIILAGGKSRRMGRNKAFLEIGGRSIIGRTIDLFNSLFDEVIIVAGAAEGYEDLGVRVVTDIFPEKGSLGGVYTGLCRSDHSYCFIASCDMPFLRDGLIRYLAGLREGVDAVVPVVGGRYEPLHAIYSKKCIRPIEEMLESGDLRIMALYPRLSIRPVTEDEIHPFNPEPSSFKNLNTPEDYQDALSRDQL